FRQRLLHPLHEKVGLQRDCASQKFPQRVHPLVVKIAPKFRARIPRTRAAREGRRLLSARFAKRDELRETFLERPALIFRIPNEMADPERCKILAGIPGREPFDSAVALVAPDAFSDLCELAL